MCHFFVLKRKVENCIVRTTRTTRVRATVTRSLHIEFLRVHHCILPCSLLNLLQNLELYSRHPMSLHSTSLASIPLSDAKNNVSPGRGTHTTLYKDQSLAYSNGTQDIPILSTSTPDIAIHTHIHDSPSPPSLVPSSGDTTSMPQPIAVGAQVLRRDGAHPIPLEHTKARSHELKSLLLSAPPKYWRKDPRRFAPYHDKTEEERTEFSTYKTPGIGPERLKSSLPPKFRRKMFDPEIEGEIPRRLLPSQIAPTRFDSEWM